MALQGLSLRRQPWSMGDFVLSAPGEGDSCHFPGPNGRGQSVRLHLRLLGDLQGVVYLDPEISDGTLSLAWPSRSCDEPTIRDPSPSIVLVSEGTVALLCPSSRWR